MAITDAEAALKIIQHREFKESPPMLADFRNILVEEELFFTTDYGDLRVFEEELKPLNVVALTFNDNSRLVQVISGGVASKWSVVLN